MVKETHHIFISQILVQGRDDVGVTSLLQELYRLYNLQEARKPGKFLSKKSWVSHVASSSEC
jgi:predicted DNA-binding protein (MmcQ/YjbR family)